MAKYKRDLKERLYEKTSPNGECLEWLGCTGVGGYGRITYKGKSVYTHIAMWKVEKGEIPNGLCVLHTCDNPKCINIAHLTLGSHRSNMEDRDKKGRWKHPGPYGSLSSVEAEQIRTSYSTGNFTIVQLSQKFKVAYNTVYLVLKNKIHKPITPVLA
jgi:hypothetical protein